MYTIGQMVKEFKISRTTLLYYDRINLLKASQRSQANYRLYSKADYEKMKDIMLYREAGIPLDSIRKLLKSKSESAGLLQIRLSQINDEIGRLRHQQEDIAKILNSKVMKKNSQAMNKEQWVKVLEDTGMTKEDMSNWHRDFERNSPKGHTDFLKSLGIAPDEIRKIKRRSKK